jgi:hypothetical protein
MANYFMAWELGGGLGHVGRLQPLAAGLHALGHTVTLGLRDLTHTYALLQPLPVPRLQAPVWLHETRGVPTPMVSLAEILLCAGYLRSSDLAALVQGWMTLLQQVRAEVMVADYAPTALLAARILGLPSASLGTGFWMPPKRQPMPPFRDWEPVQPGRVERAEAQVLASVNAVLAMHQAPPLARLCDLLHGDMPLLCSWPEIDHFERTPDEHNEWLGPNFLPEAGTAPHWPEGDGPRVFAYLKAGHPDHPAVLDALVAQGCRVACYVPEVCAGMPPPRVSPRIHYAPGPLDLATTCAEADLVVCHAGQATLVQALLRGVPLLLLPMQPEQFVMARQVERSGAAINAAARRRPTDFKALLNELLADGPRRDAARAFARKYAGFSHAGQVADLLQRLQQLPALATGR